MYLASAHPGVATFNFDRVAFDSDSAVLTAESNEQLDNIATDSARIPARERDDYWLYR